MFKRCKKDKKLSEIYLQYRNLRDKIEAKHEKRNNNAWECENNQWWSDCKLISKGDRTEMSSAIMIQYCNKKEKNKYNFFNIHIFNSETNFARVKNWSNDKD